MKTTDKSRIDSVVNAAKSAGADAYVAGYGLSDNSKAVAEARQKAVANAKENAQGMASAAGARLGKVLDISENKLYIGYSGFFCIPALCLDNSHRRP